MNPKKTVVCSYCNQRKRRWKFVPSLDRHIPNVKKLPNGLWWCGCVREIDLQEME